MRLQEDRHEENFGHISCEEGAPEDFAWFKKVFP